MKVKYLFIDDDYDTIYSLVESIESKSDDLEIKCLKPEAELSDTISKIESYKFDGLILDWKIDDTPNEKGQRPSFKTSTLSQELRSKSSLGDIPSYPIIVFSSRQNLNRFYSKDSVSHDLFDLVLKKDDVEKESEKMANQLVSLVDGYHTITEYCKKTKRKPIDLFNLNSEYDFLFDDERLVEELTSDPLLPVYNYAKFILDQIINPPGILIDEFYLAARLGLDLEKSDEWGELVNRYLSDFFYKGPFHEGWYRWWSILIERWWLSLPDNPGPLQNVHAKERVNFLVKYTGLKHLITAEPEDDDSYYFWVACAATQKPLDQLDGFVIKSKTRYPWQERLYISKKAARERIGFSNGIKIDPLEIDRYHDYLKSI